MCRCLSSLLVTFFRPHTCHKVILTGGTKHCPRSGSLRTTVRHDLLWNHTVEGCCLLVAFTVSVLKGLFTSDFLAPARIWGKNSTKPANLYNPGMLNKELCNVKLDKLNRGNHILYIFRLTQLFGIMWRTLSQAASSYWEKAPTYEAQPWNYFSWRFVLIHLHLLYFQWSSLPVLEFTDGFQITRGCWAVLFFQSDRKGCALKSNSQFKKIWHSGHLL